MKNIKDEDFDKIKKLLFKIYSSGREKYFIEIDKIIDKYDK